MFILNPNEVTYLMTTTNHFIPEVSSKLKCVAHTTAVCVLQAENEIKT